MILALLNRALMASLPGGDVVVVAGPTAYRVAQQGDDVLLRRAVSADLPAGNHTSRVLVPYRANLLVLVYWPQFC